MKFDDQSIDWAIEIDFEYLDSKSLARGGGFEILYSFVLMTSQVFQKALICFEFYMHISICGPPKICFYIVNLDVAP